jgi:hypothetical protein
MAGTVSALIRSTVSNGTVPKVPQVWSFSVQLDGTGPVTVDLRTLINIQHLNGIQSLIVDTTQGGASIVVSTQAMPSGIGAPNGQVTFMPLFLSADQTITFNNIPGQPAAATLFCLLTNFELKMPLL